MNEAASLPRVLMLATEYEFNRVGGLGAHVRALFPRLSRRARVDLVLPRYDPAWPVLETVEPHGRIRRVTTQRPRDGADFVDQIWQMNDALGAEIAGWIDSGEGFDLIHAHDWLVSFVANDLHRRFGIPLVATLHATEWGRMSGNLSADINQRIHRAESYLASHADAIIACSHFMRNEIIRELGAEAERVVVIANGVQTEAYAGLRRQREELAAFRAQWAGADEALIFNVGRLVWEKGADLLVEAMPTILREFPGARVVIAGRGSLLPDLQAAIARLGLAAHVHLAGFIDDATRNRLYAVADVAVFPSRYEPFGIVALEAMAAGTPVVVAAGSGLGEVVAPGETGLCVAPGQPQALAEGLLEVLRYPEAASARALQAQAAVRHDFNWDHIADLTLACYGRVLGEGVRGEAWGVRG
jgi:1,4-alpha-glucan branching enzyme